jgi:hypothetical protein
MTETAAHSRSLVWHICRKDLRLIWPLALGVALGQFVLLMLQAHARPFDMGDGARLTSAIFSVGLGLGLSLLIFLIVQADGVAGVDQDWLVRPIRRRDLLLAKILTVVALVHGPIFVGNLVMGLAGGFGPGASLRAALLGSAVLAVWFTLPVMAIGALTKSITEALLTGLAVLFGALILAWLASSILRQPTVDTGLAWVWGSARHGLLFTVSIAVLVWQYQRRNTVAARRLFIAGVLAFVWMPSLPWQPAFAIQQALSDPESGSRAGTLVITAVPDDSSATSATSVAGPLDLPVFLAAEERKAAKSDVPKKLVRVSQLVEFAGLPEGSLVHIDRAAVRISDADGHRLYQGMGHSFAVRAARPGDKARLLQLVDLPRHVYERLYAQKLQLQVRYYLTVLRPRVLAALPARADAQRVPELGSCASKIDDEGKGLDVACARVGEQPMCLSLSLRSHDGAAQGTQQFVCDLNYEPGALRFSGDVFDHFDANLPFAVGGVTAQDAEIAITSYDAVEHLERTLLVPSFRLRDQGQAISRSAVP